ncbi:MAG: hypothetical protein RI544_07480 [Haloquadratum sp.]|jgi:hypothetical protein|nr:hypothetical protein [Haloferacaceae archaeon]MDR9445956.1 hypothetical protein [Haloquadratum sp.]
MRETLWKGIYRLRQDGPDESYLSISLGRISEFLDVQPQQHAVVRVLEDGTVQIEVIDDESTERE